MFSKIARKPAVLRIVLPGYLVYNRTLIQNLKIPIIA